MAIRDGASREQAILETLTRELRQQDVTDVAALDLHRIAIAIEAALGEEETADELPPDIDGLEPDELNAANDS